MTVSFYGKSFRMNYLAHGIRFLTQPYHVAGTAVPDWLSVADRRVRMRAKRVESVLNQWPEKSPQHDVALGILRHLSDDDWFHTTLGFHDVTSRMTELFRSILPGDQYVNGFLGHIVTELLIDAELSDQRPDLLERYYQALEAIEPRIVQEVVNAAAKEPTSQLVPLIPLFVRERFLSDYRQSNTLLKRLNQVMKRVRLPALPESVIGVLDSGRELVAGSLSDLLPPSHFEWPPSSDL